MLVVLLLCVLSSLLLLISYHFAGGLASSEFFVTRGRHILYYNFRGCLRQIGEDTRFPKADNTTPPRPASQISMLVSMIIIIIIIIVTVVIKHIVITCPKRLSRSLRQSLRGPEAYVYIYIYSERERERERYTYVYFYVCVYIYIYIYTHRQAVPPETCAYLSTGMGILLLSSPGAFPKIIMLPLVFLILRLQCTFATHHTLSCLKVRMEVFASLLGWPLTLAIVTGATTAVHFTG